MNEEPESIWKRHLCGRAASLAWPAIISLTVVLFAIWLIYFWYWNHHGRPPQFYPLWSILVVAMLAFGLLLVGCLLLRRVFARHWQRKLVGVACFVTLMTGLFYAVEDWRGWRAWETFRRTWEAKGERFDLQSVVPPPVPEDRNFALAPLLVGTWAVSIDKTGRWVRFPDTNGLRLELAQLDFGELPWKKDSTGSRPQGRMGNWANSTLSDLTPWQEYYRELAATTNRFPVAPQPQSPAEDVLLALSKFDATVEELRLAGNLPESRFPLAYDLQPATVMLLPHLSRLKKSAQLLQMRAIAELQKGESQKALGDVRLLLRLGESVRMEPIFISQIVRLVIQQYALQPIYEGLAAHRWSEAQLAELDALLARADLLTGYRTAMRGEMVLIHVGCIEWLRRHPEQTCNFLNEAGLSEAPVPAAERYLLHLIPSGWFYQNQYRCARMMVEYYLPAVDAAQTTVSPGLVRAADRALEAGRKHSTPYNLVETMLLPALSKAATKFAYAQSATDLARTAVALERYRLVNGHPPESLDALAPQFLSSVPHDVIGGGPLKYRREANQQFVLYSIGWNETDEGGTVVSSTNNTASVDTTQGDWVWRYPTK